MASLWLTKVSFDLKEDLLLPSLLQETGKFVLADVIESEKKAEDFKKELALNKTISEVEKEFTGTTTSKITAQIFRHWKLSDNLTNVIENVDSLENCSDEYRKKSEILDVIKTICDVTDPMSIESIEKGIAKAKKYNLDIKSLESAIEKLEDRLLDE